MVDSVIVTSSTSCFTERSAYGCNGYQYTEIHLVAILPSSYAPHSSLDFFTDTTQLCSLGTHAYTYYSRPCSEAFLVSSFWSLDTLITWQLLIALQFWSFYTFLLLCSFWSFYTFLLLCSFWSLAVRNTRRCRRPKNQANFVVCAQKKNKNISTLDMYLPMSPGTCKVSMSSFTSLSNHCNDDDGH